MCGEQLVNGLSFIIGVCAGVLIVMMTLFMFWQVMIYNKTKNNKKKGDN